MVSASVTAKLVCACVGVLAIAVGAPSAAYAANSSFGTYVYTAGAFYGTGVGITAPPTSQTVASNNIILNRADIDTTSESDPAAMQAGLYRSGSHTQLDMCPEPNSDSYQFIETHVLNSGANGYVCLTYSRVSAGTTGNFDVYAEGAGPDATWAAKINGSIVAQEDLGDITTAHSLVGGEIGSTTSHSYQSFSEVNYTNAGEGTNWHQYAHINQGDPVVVTDQGNVALASGQNTSDWTLGAVPTPFSVNHPVP
jgi:hypothetical protein